MAPSFFLLRLTGEIYSDFLRHNRPQLLEDITLDVKQNIWLLHDGAPPHFTREVHEHLDNEFLNGVGYGEMDPFFGLLVPWF